MQFDTKIAIVLDEQLAGWQKANVTAFLISGIVATDPAVVGQPYIDGSGNRYLPMCRQPIMVYAADPAGLRRAYERAMARKVERLAIFTHDLFTTPHDHANRAARVNPSSRTKLRRHRPPRGAKDRRQSPRQAPAPPVTQRGHADNRPNKRIRNRWQPTATVPQRMVRTGSTVRSVRGVGRPAVSMGLHFYGPLSSGGTASRRSSGITSPLSVERPYVPPARRASARSTAASCSRRSSARPSSNSSWYSSDAVGWIELVRRLAGVLPLQMNQRLLDPRALSCQQRAGSVWIHRATLPERTSLGRAPWPLSGPRLTAVRVLWAAGRASGHSSAG